MYGPPDLPDIEQLVSRDPEPERGPGELSALVRHQMGEADAPQRQPADRPDVAGLRRELGL